MSVLTYFKLPFKSCCGCYRNVIVYFTALLVSNVIEAGPNVLQSLLVSSALSRAILKPVYRFGIPESDPQTLKSVKINSSKNRQMTVHARVLQCALSLLSYSECKNRSSSKNRHPQKLLNMALLTL